MIEFKCSFNMIQFNSMEYDIKSFIMTFNPLHTLGTKSIPRIKSTTRTSLTTPLRVWCAFASIGPFTKLKSFPQSLINTYLPRRSARLACNPTRRTLPQSFSQGSICVIVTSTHFGPPSRAHSIFFFSVVWLLCLLLTHLLLMLLCDARVLGELRPSPFGCVPRHSGIR